MIRHKKLLQKILHKYPFYKHYDNAVNDINVVVIGQSNFGFHFIDMMLQIGQVNNKTLRVSWVISSEQNSIDKYMESRPQLSEFVDINGSMSDSDYRPYAYIKTIGKDDYESIEAIGKIAYIMADFSSEYYSESIEAALNICDSDTVSLYLQDGDNICVHCDGCEEEYLITDLDFDDKLLAMAFNAHIIWEGKGNVDYVEARKRFEKDYYLMSSVDYVLSIAGKLVSVGIHVSNEYDTAKAFRAICKGDSAILETLGRLEHRQWVLRKLTEGYTVLTEENYPVMLQNAKVADAENKRHPNIVHVEELIQTSQNIHNFLKAEADNRRENFFDAPSILALKLFVNNHTPLDVDHESKVWVKFSNVLHAIRDGSLQYADQYETYENELRDSCTLNNSEKSALDNLLKAVFTFVFPILESNQNRDYYRANISLIESTSTILTKPYKPVIAMALYPNYEENGENTDIFKNIAAATLLHPGRIIYFYYDDGRVKRSFIENKLKGIKNYLRKRKIDTKIDPVHYIPSKDYSPEGAINYIERFIDKTNVDFWDGSTLLFQSMSDNAEMIHSIKQKIPYFEFEAARKIFISSHNCEHLRYISDTSFIQLEDMFALRNATEKKLDYPDFGKIYMEMWNIYTGDYASISFHQAARQWIDFTGVVSEKFKQNSYNISEDISLSVVGTEYVEGRGNVSYDFSTILPAMLANGFIISGDDPQSAPVINFKISDLKVADLLTNEGKILEVYTYFKCFDLGYFDDIASGYEFAWEQDNVSNELDCVMTKGFRSMFVECKSRSRLSMDFYFKIDELANRFGIEPIVVIVANAYGENYTHRMVNNLQISRGRQLNIYTVNNEADLRNIGNKLKDIMENSII